MKISNQNITLIIYLALLTVVISIWIWELKTFDERLRIIFSWENLYTFSNIIYALKLTNLFTASLASIVFVVGIFLKKETGWILITGWFYFFLFNSFSSLIKDGMYEGQIEFFFILFFIVIIGLILTMNNFGGIKKYHNVDRKNKIKLNFKAIGIAVLLVGFRIFKNYLLENHL